MRPQDIAILLYLVNLDSTNWKLSEIEQALQIKGTSRVLPLCPTLPAIIAEKSGYYALLRLCDAV